MKRIALLLALAATLTAAQTPKPIVPKPPSVPTKQPPVSKPAGGTTTKAGTGAATPKKPGVATTPRPKSAAHAPAAKSTSIRRDYSASISITLPPGVPVAEGRIKSAFALQYQDVQIGTGALAEPGKVYKVHYTGWLASDGTKFDSSYDHRAPVLDKDNKPEKNDDGSPKLGDPQPLVFPQGRGRLIPGWDQGFEGMKVGGKRRLFIPYQLAYGALGRPPKIPAKSDLIFDVELMDVTDMPAQNGMPGGMPGRPMPPRPTGAAPGAPATPPPGAIKMVAPKSEAPASPAATPAPATPAPATPPPTAAPTDKPSNPAQPN